MLRLNLKPKQEVFISDNIRIVVIKIDKMEGRVELGFDAPREIKILRKHFYMKTKENEERKNQEQKDTNNKLE